MAFQTPPTFVDGDVLSASQLNILAANQNYLNGVAVGVNLAFRQTAVARETSQSYHVVHTANNLYLRVTVPDNDTKVQVYYKDGSGLPGLVYDSGADVMGELIVNHDISGDGIVLGDRYTVEVACRDKSGPSPAGTITLQYLCESGDEL
jgi:hypothetical protein